MSDDFVEHAVRGLAEIRLQHPLVHNITNYVVMNWSANILLALGASPVMAHAIEEVEELAGIAGALVLNIGTLSAPWVDSMFKASTSAHKRGVPIVLDPVGAGATLLRTNTALRFLKEGYLNVVRGNASEILALAGGVGGRGVDSLHTLEQARAAAVELAQNHKIVVAVTGAVDYVTDGIREAYIENGHALMGRVTGTGCAATAIIGAFCAVERGTFAATVSGLVTFGIAGELAARGEPRPGTYQIRLLDALDEVNENNLRSMARVRIAETK